jgi:hypothetical protein
MYVDSYDLICCKIYPYNADSVHILNNFLYTLKFFTSCLKIDNFEWLINLALEVGKYRVSSVMVI